MPISKLCRQAMPFVMPAQTAPNRRIRMTCAADAPKRSKDMTRRQWVCWKLNRARCWNGEHYPKKLNALWLMHCFLKLSAETVNGMKSVIRRIRILRLSLNRFKTDLWKKLNWKTACFYERDGRRQIRLVLVLYWKESNSLAVQCRIRYKKRTAQPDLRLCGAAWIHKLSPVKA